MLRQNIKVFLLFLIIIIFFILFKNGQILDLGVIFRNSFASQNTVNSIFSPPDDLEEQYKNLLVENNQLKVLERENEELRQLLNLKKERGYNLVIANILSRDPVNRNILIINVGKTQGLENGQAVVVNNGIIIGKIMDAGLDSSKLRLLTDNFSKLAVRTGEGQKVSGVLSGSLGLVMDLSYIPQEEDIKKNDLLVTADLDVKIPAGLVVGRVDEVQFSQEEVFKRASVSPLVNYDTLGILAVITSL
ncbi:rod shape-determining protein MreC [bacterium]|nr:rod shape-determining protein MreC [bacterium]